MWLILVKISLQISLEQFRSGLSFVVKSETMIFILPLENGLKYIFDFIEEDWRGINITKVMLGKTEGATGKEENNLYELLNNYCNFTTVKITRTTLINGYITKRNHKEHLKLLGLNLEVESQDQDKNQNKE